ncbi:hypothetical protein A3C59_04455 [Candidatus Daviesbacteria bacterium RIFCSPHIGHO2_02_FULL_36_13]|uniref:Uncharacterized protein n=1 Tax=Candidatus Daviesbacteria bacterium RIFCSPHIGHO2_02_FULL_36_13 TaxID=1797768 RepID=A0A1F5JVZ6_9BACT|nr:MAG: hypothetical protein A3C59_04455 [Candidatus Daviesbacteria bacterium RIFCSPHIGHO2_02_FULL_36_13]OGE43276.1 MAG: hypothetical protein A3A45_03105 [Candidatus Daviesbacteria bacterium RIFCSPLOWO2_01_FULL_36_8]
MPVTILPERNLALSPFLALSDLISLSSWAKPARIVSTNFSVGLSPVGSVEEMIVTPFSDSFFLIAK